MHHSSAISEPLSKRALRGLLRLLFRISIAGDPASFHNERTLIVANHESLIDGLLLAVFLPVRATFVLHTEVARNPLFRRLLTLIPHVLAQRVAAYLASTAISPNQISLLSIVFAVVGASATEISTTRLGKSTFLAICGCGQLRVGVRPTPSSRHQAGSGWREHRQTLPEPDKAWLDPVALKVA
ncbi:MAG: 1-acyl-sn-glycerol-3-phosphate acyltransferase [Steroidobacteraceae bacterium]